MIALGNNIYRTLDDKFYLGTQQIGKVYLGENLIYPENQTVIGGITIDTDYNSLNGNVFDLGYAPTKNTRFECCFIPDDVSSTRAFFGTSHDDKFNYRYRYYLDANDSSARGNPVTSTSTDTYIYYNVKVKNNGSYVTVTKNSSTWNNDYVGNNGYANYNAYTKFHLIKGSTKFSLRYGGEQHTSQGENDKPTSMTAGKPYVIGLDDFSGTKKWYTGSGKFGKYYYVLNNEEIPQNVQNMLRGASTLSSNSTFSDNKSGGNIWINAVNREISNPNVKRPYDNVNHTFDNDLIYYNESGNIGFIYMIIWESGGKKTLYTQHKNSSAVGDVLIYKYVQVSDGQGGWKFKDPDPNTGEVPVDEIIYPFYRFQPV